MTGVHLDIVAEGDELGFYGPYQGVVVSAGEIGPPDGSGKQGVSRKAALAIGQDQGDPAWGVSGGFQNLERVFAKVHHVTLCQEAVRSGRLLDIYPEESPHPGRGLEDGEFRSMQHDLRTGGILDRTVGTNMIHMGMGIDDPYDLDVQPLDLPHDPLPLAAWVDDKGLFRLLVAHDETVGHELGNHNRT